MWTPYRKDPSRFRGNEKVERMGERRGRMTKGRNARSKKKEREKREGEAGERELMKLPGRWPNFFPSGRTAGTWAVR